MNYPDNMDFSYLDGEFDDRIEEIYSLESCDIVVASEFADILDITFYSIIDCIVMGKPLKDDDIEMVKKHYHDAVIEEAERRSDNGCM